MKALAELLMSLPTVGDVEKAEVNLVHSIPKDWNISDSNPLKLEFYNDRILLELLFWVTT